MSLVRSRAFWPGVRRVLRAAGLIVCLGFPVFSTEINAQSPAPSSAVQSIDAASLSSIVDLDGPWRFHAGDDPRFADPALDDSAWPAIRLNQNVQTIGIPSLPAGWVWARIHLRVPATSGRLALAVYPHLADQNEIFVNGSPIASSPGIATRTLWYHTPLPVVLPWSADIVLAIRFYTGQFRTYSLPAVRVSLGSFDAVRAAIEFDRLRAFDDYFLADYACICVYLVIFLTVMILYGSQRDHDEYLWLGIFALNFALYDIIDIVVCSGWLPFTNAVMLLIDYTGWLTMVTQIEFVMRFTRIRRRWPIRIVQGALLISAWMRGIPSLIEVFLVALVLAFLAVLAVEAVCLISAFRRGLAGSGLLLIPIITSAALNLAWATAILFPADRWGLHYRFGPVGIAGNNLSSVAFCLGIVAVVLYRFIRVARDEARAAAELEAARTVQQILVPEEIPTIPGFSVQAVYQPAGDVGGDFYQVLPAPNGGLLAIIGDVSGKGTPAAMIVSLLVGTVRTLAHYTQDPAEILAAMNQRMIGRGNGGFTTALVLRLDPEGTLTAANAGHLSPYADGKELDLSNGLPLGITAAAAYTNSTLRLDAGTTLTLLTDGVVEAQNDKGELFGFERAAEISSKPAQNLAAAARTFGQQDDITVLSLAWVAGG